ncbi:MAG TPA: glycosyltransferase family 4 protein [Candidatus Limnocylindrales bacterium]|nr:glycosyltransferase family 4 protein [Candidatus Limnocylindrales bacterium]
MGGLTILTWHIHGSYLDALGHTGQDIVVPVRPGRPERFAGRPDDATWPSSIREVPADAVRDLDVDLVLYQHAANWTVDQHEILSPSQLRGPRVFVEHDPPREHPTDTRHHVDDPAVLIVQVTAFNALMWDTGPNTVRVVEHGIPMPAGVRWTGELARGLVVVNELNRRGRRLGADLVADARSRLPIDVAGMGSEAIGGLGAFAHDDLIRRQAAYRFVFHPARWTSFGMAVCEAMLLGQPVVALAATEMPTVIVDGVNGFASTDPARLERSMRALLEDRDLAARIGAAGYETARERFSIERFAADWNIVFEEAMDVALTGSAS